MPDPYTAPDEQIESTIQAMITRLEERGRHRGFLDMIHNYLKTLSQNKPLKVLDLGCGTGVVILQIAEFLHPSSQLYGADVSAVLLKEAKRLSSNRITWDYLTTSHLPYEDSSLDVITMHTLMSHVSDPVFLLSEARRVLNENGKLIVFDADHAGTTYNQPDYETTRRFDHLLTKAIATNPDICRQLPRLLKAAGFQLLKHSVDVISECGQGDYWLSSVQGFSRLMPSIGALSESEARSWVDYMLKSHEEGTFFAAGAFYTFHAKPESEL